MNSSIALSHYLTEVLGVRSILREEVRVTVQNEIQSKVSQPFQLLFGGQNTQNRLIVCHQWAEQFSERASVNAIETQEFWTVFWKMWQAIGLSQNDIQVVMPMRPFELSEALVALNERVELLPQLQETKAQIVLMGSWQMPTGLLKTKKGSVTILDSPLLFVNDLGLKKRTWEAMKRLKEQL